MIWVIYDKMKWIKMHVFLTILVLGVVGFILLNVLAYRHARAMLRFTEAGARTDCPESLSFFRKAKTLLSGVNIPRPENRSDPSELGVEFTTHKFRSADDTELEAWYVPCEGAKGLVLLFHGYATSKAHLLSVVGAFREIGFSTFLIDFRGSGGSDGDYTSVGYREADDVISAVEYARTISGHTKVILYGQSMGGAAILRAISALGLKPDLVLIEGVFDVMLTTVRARFSAMRVPSFPSAHLLTFWGGRQMGYSGFQHNPADYARDVDCPVLMLHGDEDPRATIDQAEAIFRNLAGPKHLERFAGVGHDSCYDAAPEQWKQAVFEFLARTKTGFRAERCTSIVQ